MAALRFQLPCAVGRLLDRLMWRAAARWLHIAQRAILLLQIVLAAALCSAPSVMLAQSVTSAAPAPTIELRLKAASLVRFLSYVEWPGAAVQDKPYVIGVIGADDVADELARISAGRNVGNRAIAIKRLLPADVLTGIDELYIGFTDAAKIGPLTRRAQQQPILIVTQADGALAAGSMVNFRIVDDRLRFEVALDKVEQAGLKMSSRMLTVALQVNQGQPR